MIDRYLESILLKQRGQNDKLVQEIKENLSPEARERLFRVLQDMENDIARYRRESRNFSHAVHSAMMFR